MNQLERWSLVVCFLGVAVACGAESKPGAGPGGAGTSNAGASGALSGAGAGASGAAGSPSAGSGGAAGGAALGCSPACSAEQACVVGTCRPKPVELARVEGCGSMHLAVSKGTLYFTDAARGSVKSVPVAGGAPAELATGQKSPYAIAVDDAGTVYWSNSSATVGADNTLMMKPAAGAATKIADVNQATASTGSTNIAKSIALDGKGNLFFAARSDLLKVAASANATPTKIGAFSGLPTAIVLTPTRVFTTLGVANAVEWRNPDPASSGCTDPITRPEPVDGETPEQKTARVNGSGCAFSQSVGNLFFEALSLAGSNVLFIDGTSIQIADTTVPSTMQAMRKQVAATDSFDPISGFTNTETAVYFGEASTGIIEKAALPVGTPEILVEDATLQVAPSSFVNDGTNLYWRTESCAIYKLPL